MAFSAVNAPVAFNEGFTWHPDQLIYVPGVAGTTYTKGEALAKTAVGATANAGLFVDAADSGAAALVRVMKTTVCSAATTGYPRSGAGGKQDWIGDDNALGKSLIPCQLLGGKAVKAWLAPFTGYADDTVAAYTAATPSITLTTALGANDDPNGGLVYVYGGTGAGQWNHIVDYVNATKVATLARQFETALSTDSTVIILEGEGSSVGGMGILGRCDLEDEDKIDVADGADDGDYIILADARLVGRYLERGCLPVARYSDFL